MATEFEALDEYIQTVLQADSQLTATGIMGYFAHSVPAQAPTPYILLTYNGSVDNNTVGTTRANTEIFYIVRVVDQAWAFTSTMQTAAERIDKLLQGKTGSAFGYTIEGGLRVRPYVMVEETKDLPWRHLGGRYHFWVSQ